MNDGFDPLYAVRSYGCEKSRISRDKWLAYRKEMEMPVIQNHERFADIPGQFAKQFAAMRDKKPEATRLLLQAGKGES